MGRRAWLGLGANLGDRVAQLRAALDALADEGLAVEAVSSVYETSPWGVEDQPPFANAVCACRGALTPHELLALAKAIERDAGRDAAGERYGPRPLDVDILLVEDEMLSAPDLQVPHRRMHERAFVLVPLAEVAPDLVHPALAQTARGLLDALPQAERDDPAVLVPRGWWPGTPSS